ncbi:MAG: hypothetical protein ABH954_04635 [Candidatus Omnitrophota bacterium]
MRLVGVSEGIHYVNYHVTDHNEGWTSAQVPIIVDPYFEYPPVIIQPLANSIVRVGETVNIPITARSPYPAYDIELSAANVIGGIHFEVTNQQPGLTTGMLYVHPEAQDVGIHNIQFNAQAQGYPLYALGTLRIQVKERRKPPPIKLHAIPQPR